MTLLVNVAGGTNAGRRVVREPARAWIHVCNGWFGKPRAFANGRLLDACYIRCPFCGCKRPS